MQVAVTKIIGLTLAAWCECSCAIAGSYIPRIIICIKVYSIHSNPEFIHSGWFLAGDQLLIAGI